MKLRYKVSFYLFTTILLLSMSIFTGSALATLEEPEIPQIPPPQLEKPVIPDLKIPQDSSQLLLTDKIYVVWKQVFQGNTKLFLKKSTDGGNTFGPATTITSTNNDIPESYRMKIDAIKNIYLVWARDDGVNTKLFLKKSTDGGNTFGPAITITSTNNDLWHSSMDIDTSKNIYVAWEDGPSGNREVFLKKSTDGGNTFGQTINVSNDPGISRFPEMAIDTNNNMYIVWKEAQVIYLKKSMDGGNTFGSATTISAPAVEGALVEVFLNNTYVVWRTETQNDEIYLKKSTDGGNTFGQTVNVSNTPKDSYNHDLAVYGNNVYVTWREELQTGLKLLIKRSTDGGNTFGSAKLIWQSPSNSDNVMPRIALSSAISVYAVWRDIDLSNPVNPALTILFKKSTNGGNLFVPPDPKIINSGKGTPSYLAIIAVIPKPF